EGPAALVGDLVDAAAAPARLRPAAGDVPGALEAAQRRIDGAAGEVEPLAAALAERADDGVAVGLAAQQRGEDERVELAVNAVCVHGIPAYAILGRRS